MLDRQALFDKLLDYLQSEPTVPEYLEGQPEAVVAFDPYEIVSEWIALRQEIKQQNKLFLAAQEKLERAVAARQSEPVASAASPPAAQADKGREREQEALLRELLPVVDALDRACDYGRKQAEEFLAPSPLPAPTAKTLRERLAAWLVPPSAATASTEAAAAATVSEILTSNQQGMDLIRRNLLDILRQRQVTPIEAVGKPFDPQYMHAIGRQESTTVPENRVVQEVVRGYLWQQQVLREAQVIVSAGTGQVADE